MITMFALLGENESDKRIAESVFSDFWVGFVLVSTILPNINLVTPLATPVVYYSALGCSIFTWLAHPSLRHKLAACRTVRWKKTRQSRNFLWLISLIFGMILCATWVAAPVTNFDSYLYQLSRVEYYSQERFVVGIGNLHSRLAFPSQHFATSAFLNGGPLGIYGFRALSASLVAVSLAQMSYLLGKTFSSFIQLLRHRKFPKFPASSILFICASSLLVRWALTNVSDYITSPSPDFAASLLLIVASLSTVRFLEKRNHRTYWAALIMILGAAQYRPTVIANIAIFFLLVHWIPSFSQRGTFLKSKRRLLIFGALLTLWAVPSLLAAGSLIYPSPSQLMVFSILPWSLSYGTSVGETMWIKAWARLPGPSPEQTLANWDWLDVWFARYRLPVLAVIGTLIVIALFSWFGRASIAQYEDHIKRSDLSMTGRALSLAFLAVPAMLWFYLAPDPRFGWGAIYVLAFSPLVVPILLSSENQKDLENFRSSQGSVLWRAAPLLLTSTGCVGLLLWTMKLPDVMTSFSTLSIAPTTPVNVEYDRVIGEQVLFRANADSICGQNLWCTPYPRDLNVRRFLGLWLVSGA